MMQRTQNVGVTGIKQKGDRTLHIDWSDGRSQDLDVVFLRKVCPCAACVNEWTGVRMNQSIGDAVRPVSLQSVGRYAMQIVFDDGITQAFIPTITARSNC